MRANVKPLTHWIIYKSYSVRFSSRSVELVTGVLTTPEGPLNFEYEPKQMRIHLKKSVDNVEKDEQVQINEYGWEIEE